MSLEADATKPGMIGRYSLRDVRHRLIYSSLFRHNALLFAVNMLTSAFSYLFHPIVGRLLGPNGYGSVASLLALSAVLLIPTQIVSNIANKFAADLAAQGRVDQISYLFRKATRYALIVGVAAALIFAGLSSMLSSFLKLSSIQPIIITSIGILLAFAAPLNFGIIQGRQQFGWFGLSSFLVSFLRVVFTAMLLMIGLGVNGALVAILISGVVVYGLSFIPLGDVLRTPPMPISSLKPMLAYSLGATLALGGGILLTNTDTILAKHFLSPTEAGYYAALGTIGRIVLFVGGSFVWVMFPKVAALRQQGRPHRAILAWTMAGVFVLSAGALVLFWLFPSQIVTLIFHAPAQVTQLLFWYGLSMLLLALANVLIYYYLSVGRMAFVPILLVCCASQAVLIVIWHSNLAQIVTVMVLVMALLLGALALLYAAQMMRDGKNAYQE